MAADISLQKVDGRHIMPEVKTINDWGSGTNDDILAPDSVLEVTGAYRI